jgi:hypothetical protein
VCAFENVIKKVEVFKVEVQNGTLRFGEKTFIIDVLVS